MRRLAWVSGLISLIAGGWTVAAQAQPSTAAVAGPPALQARMFPSARSDLQFALSDSAYVAMFEISPGRGVELLYPESYDAGMHAGGDFYIHPTDLDQGEEEREIAFTGRPYTGFPPCYLLVASRAPLHVSQYATHPLAPSEALHEQFPSIGHPTAVLGTVLNADLPADSADWATDMYCEPGYQVAGLDQAEVGLALWSLNPGGTYFGGFGYNSFELSTLAWRDPQARGFGDPDVGYCSFGMSLESPTESAVPRSACAVQARALDELLDCHHARGSDITACRPTILPRREPQQQPVADSASGGRVVVAGQPARIRTEGPPISGRAASASGDRGSSGRSRGPGDGHANGSNATPTITRVSSSGGTSNGSGSNPEHSGSSGASHPNTGTTNAPSNGGAGGFGGGTGGGGNSGNAGSFSGARPSGRP